MVEASGASARLLLLAVVAALPSQARRPTTRRADRASSRVAPNCA